VGVCNRGLFGKGLTGLNTRVVEHIRFAKDWLDRAEHQFCSSESIQGELTLTLAQAELRCAWEESRASRTGTQSAPMFEQKKKGKYLSSVVMRQGLRIALILLAILAGFFINTPYESPDMLHSTDGFSVVSQQELEEDAVVPNMGRLREDIDTGLRKMATVFAQSEQVLVPDPSYSAGLERGTFVITDTPCPQTVDSPSNVNTEVLGGY
jgi:hypothetical protein